MGQHAYAVCFFRLFCIVPFFFSRSPSSKCSSLLCRSTFLTIQFSTGWFWANFSANHPDSGWLAHIRQHNLCCTLLKEMARKRSSWVSHKMDENVAFCVFEDSKSNFVTQRLHSHFNWVFSLDSVERNGEQKAFLGKLQKGENSCFVWIYEDSTSNFINRQLHSHFVWVSTVHFHLWVRMHGQFLFRASILISRICSKSFSNWICSVSCFWQKSRFLTEIKPSELQILASWESNEEENLTRFIQKFALKAVQTEFAMQFDRERNHFLTECKRQNSNMASREWKGQKILHSWFKTLVWSASN